jgi:hypothetical protein
VSPQVQTYDFKVFLEACGRPESMLIKGTMIERARIDFGLNSKADILKFIINDGLKELSFQYTTPLLRKDGSPTGKMIDAYHFRSLGKLGYLAFFLNENKQIWTIKSFHISDTANTTLKDAFEKAGYFKTEHHETKEGPENEQ